jgi:uridine phosphorylase
MNYNACMNEMQYHLSISKDMIQEARYAVVVGDPDRVPFLAQAFDPEAQCLANHRGYVTYLAQFLGQSILVSTTGIGGPSTSIVIEELANIGIKYFLRIGTTGAIQNHIKLGDLIVTEASVRLDGASTHYAPIEFPAVASLGMTSSIIEAAKFLGLPYHSGITVSADTFYPGQERYDNFAHYVIKRFQGTLVEWQKLGALNYEMESATLLTMCRVLGLEAACFCGVIANRHFSEKPSTDTLASLREVWTKMAVKTLELDLLRRGLVASA